MSATFPNGIANFTPKQDNTDVNYAAHINRLQEEMVAVQTVLGPLINTITDISDDGDEFATQTSTKFANVGSLISWLQNGYHVRAARASGTQYAVAGINNLGKFQSTMPSLLKLDAPTINQDPYALYNGSGFTLNKSGFWLLVGNVRVNVGERMVTGDTTVWEYTAGNHAFSTKNAGAYQACIEWGGEWTHGMDRKEIVPDGGTYPDMFLNPVVMGWFSAGTRINLRFSQSSGFAQQVARASLSAVHFRMPGPHNTAP